MARKAKLRVHQFHSGSAVADAVTNSMLFVQSMLRSMGFESNIFVQHLDPALSDRIQELADLRVTQDDLLLIHHSMGHDALPRLAGLACRKFLIYHNITPPGFFAKTDSTYEYAVKGYWQLTLLRDVVESAVAVSTFNAQQLRQRDFENVTVIPLVKDFGSIRYAPHLRTPYHDDSATVRLLFVGRIVPHKRQHELIEFVDKVRSIGRVPLALTLIGNFDNADDYKQYLDELVCKSGLHRNVNILGRVTDAELFGWYRAASAYVSLSEHEGFGVPLVEAMALDLPVIAYPSSAVPDTLGDAGIILADKNPASILGPLLRLQEDRAFRTEIIRSQRRRLLDFSRKHIECEFRRWLLQAGAFEGNEAFDIEAPPEHGPLPKKRTHYVIEGPFETSYSLAIVNRNLALALNEREACASHIEPAEGVESYSVDPIAANSQPSKIQDLVRPAPLDAERIVTIRNTYPPRPNGMLGDLRLVHLAWEESSISDRLAGLMNLHLDGVLVPSEYSKRAIRNSGVRVPIRVIGHGIDHLGVPPRIIGDRMARGKVTPSLPFTFLHISSGLARKGIEELITAYCMAFTSFEPVLLVIKTIDNPTNTVDSWVERLTSAYEYSPAIQIIAEELDQQQIEFLYHVADVLVLPTRGEGFNFPAAEGMARGLPVIVTRHSGHLDFCNDQNSFLIDCTYEISISHLKIPNSFWARVSVDQLIQVMKAVYRAGRSPDAATALRASQGQQDALQLRWHDVAERVDRFVEYLGNRPAMSRKLRIGWVSTYNARCGIATYSEHLLEFFDKAIFDITIIADDQEAIGSDPDNILRLWKKGGVEFARVIDHLIANNFDAVFVQYNHGFFEIDDFAEMLFALSQADIQTYVTLHRTKGLESSQLALHGKIGQALRGCTRIFVHNLDDVNRLRECGVAENIVLLPHGVIDRTPLNTEAVRGLLGLSDFTPVIGTFGFLLPGKGLPELIHSFARALRAHPAAYLLMVNADYPVPESRVERARCLALVRQLDIEGQTRLISEFLDIEEALFLLSACDAIVFPYQRSEESASGAVRLGLAAGRPVLTTPLSVFSDLSEIVYQLPGTNARDIADGIISFMADEDRKTEILRRQRDWVQRNSWATQADRISNIVCGCFEETRGVDLRASARVAAHFTRPPDGEPQKQNSSNSSPEQNFDAMLRFFKPRPAPWQKKPAGRQPIDIADQPSSAISPANSSQSVGRGSGLLRRLASAPSRVLRQEAETSPLSRADRARDSRDWPNAAHYYQKALEENPQNSAIWVQYGHAIKEAGNLSRAEDAYRKSLDLNADVADTHLQLGHSLKLQGRKIEASAAYFRALVIDPALDHAASELRALGWTNGRIQLALRREQSKARDGVSQKQ